MPTDKVLPWRRRTTVSSGRTLAVPESGPTRLANAQRVLGATLALLVGLAVATLGLRPRVVFEPPYVSKEAVAKGIDAELAGWAILQGIEKQVSDRDALHTAEVWTVIDVGLREKLPDIQIAGSDLSVQAVLGLVKSLLGKGDPTIRTGISVQGMKLVVDVRFFDGVRWSSNTFSGEPQNLEKVLSQAADQVVAFTAPEQWLLHKFYSDARNCGQRQSHCDYKKARGAIQLVAEHPSPNVRKLARTITASILLRQRQLNEAFYTAAYVSREMSWDYAPVHLVYLDLELEGHLSDTGKSVETLERLVDEHPAYLIRRLRLLSKEVGEQKRLRDAIRPVQHQTMPGAASNGRYRPLPLSKTTRAYWDGETIIRILKDSPVVPPGVMAYYKAEFELKHKLFGNAIGTIKDYRRSMGQFEPLDFMEVRVLTADKKWSKVLESIDERRTVADASPLLLLYRANALLELGRPRLAVEALHKAIALDPKQKLPHLFLADHYLIECRFDQMAVHWSAFKALADPMEVGERFGVLNNYDWISSSLKSESPARLRNLYCDPKRKRTVSMRD